MAVQCIAHVGICVSDLPRSRRFYRDALGFREVARLTSSGAAAEKLLQMRGAHLEGALFERDGLRIELMHFVRPAATAGPTPRPMNQVGFTHLAIRVDALEATVAALRRAGATPLEDTWMEIPELHARALIVLDPDGTRLELIETPGDPAVPIGQLVSPDS